MSTLWALVLLASTILVQSLSCPMNTLCSYNECRGLLLVSPQVADFDYLSVRNYDTFNLTFKINSKNLMRVVDLQLIDVEGLI